jgi:hypothetical protein
LERAALFKACCNLSDLGEALFNHARLIM